VRALSLNQPWLWAVLYAGKRIENRVKWTDCSFRGPILLHASKGVGSRREFDAAASAVLDVWDPPRMQDRFHPPFAEARGDLRGLRGEVLWSPRATLPRGGIVGRARIDGVIKNEADMAAYAANHNDGAKQRAWWMGTFALVLTDVEVLPFMPWKGELGLFNVDESKLRAA